MTNEERLSRYAEAMWPNEWLPEDLAHPDFRRVMNLVDAEVAAAVSEAQAGAERLADINRELVDTHNTYLKMVVRLEERAESAEAEVERLREGIRALADEWAAESGAGWWSARVRALLAPSPAATTGEADQGSHSRLAAWGGAYSDETNLPAPVSSDEAATGEAVHNLLASDCRKRTEGWVAGNSCPLCSPAPVSSGED